MSQRSAYFAQMQTKKKCPLCSLSLDALCLWNRISKKKKKEKKKLLDCRSNESKYSLMIGASVGFSSEWNVKLRDDSCHEYLGGEDAFASKQNQFFF